MRTGMLTTALAVLLAPGAAAAQAVTADAGAIAKVLQTKGYQAEVTKGSDGDPMIRSAASGTRFVILFFGCEKGLKCTSVQFYAGFKTDGKTPLEKINEWNRTKRFGRAYKDKDNDPVVEMDVDLDNGGINAALFADQLEIWDAVVGDFKKMMV